MNRDFTIDRGAADAWRQRLSFVHMPRAHCNEADAWMRPIPCGSSSRLFLLFSVFSLVCLTAQSALCANVVFSP